jgi:DNA polymerase-3 subunit beta
VKVSLLPNALNISGQAQNVGEAEEELPATYDGEAFHIGYNATYLLDLLRTMDSEQVLLSFKGPTNAGVFTPVVGEGEPDLLCLVMPLRLPGTEGSDSAVAASAKH